MKSLKLVYNNQVKKYSTIPQTIDQLTIYIKNSFEIDPRIPYVINYKDQEGDDIIINNNYDY